MLIQLTSPSGVAAPRSASCDVHDNVRRVPAKRVRLRRPRLDPPSAGTPLVPWLGTVAANYGAVGVALAEGTW